ncbi:MAG: hypothetical protein LBJ02_06085 [Bifidobacteriaceae bacterium]|nr:hypothetical protein [Bifidobacteriaceae bacterium]
MTTFPNGDWDDALADLLASASGQALDDAAGSPTSAGAVGGTDTQPRETPESPPGQEFAFEVPPLPWGDNAPDVAVLLLGVADKWLLAAILKGPQIAARALTAEGLGVAVLDDPAEEAALEAARTASDTLRGQQILLLRRGESTDLAAGDIQAYLYTDGDGPQKVSPGLVLAQSPQVLEDLLIDPQAAAPALAGAVDVSGLSAAEAIAIIGRSVSAARKAKRARRPRHTSGHEGRSLGVPLDPDPEATPDAGPDEAPREPGGPDGTESPDQTGPAR